MASEWIGILRGFETGQLYAVINPDDDSELDNPRFLLLQGPNGEPVQIVKIPRAEYMTLTDNEQIIAVAERIAGRR